jgi:hypothetical protein
VRGRRRPQRQTKELAVAKVEEAEDEGKELLEEIGGVVLHVGGGQEQ